MIYLWLLHILVSGPADSWETKTSPLNQNKTNVALHRVLNHTMNCSTSSCPHGSLFTVGTIRIRFDSDFAFQRKADKIKATVEQLFPLRRWNSYFPSFSKPSHSKLNLPKRFTAQYWTADMDRVSAVLGDIKKKKFSIVLGKIIHMHCSV